MNEVLLYIFIIMKFIIVRLNIKWIKYITLIICGVLRIMNVNVC